MECLGDGQLHALDRERALEATILKLGQGPEQDTPAPSLFLLHFRWGGFPDG